MTGGIRNIFPSSMELFVTRYFALDTVPRYIEDIPWIDTCEKQEFLIAQTVLDISHSRYPLPPHHVRALLETIVRTCELHKLEVAEIVYEELSKSLMHVPLLAESFGSYKVDNNRVFFETDACASSAFVKDGSTGFCTWEAGKCLAWFLCEQFKYNNEAILELGCGTGVTGIVVSKVLGLDKGQYTFTDYHESTLDQAKRNCEMNGVVGQFKSIDILDHRPDDAIESDIIVGADILYDTDLCRGLVKWLSSQDACRSFKEAFIMSTIRTDSTYESFKKALDDNKDKLSWNVVHSMRMSEWIAGAQSGELGRGWSLFLDSNKRLFDPQIELVRIVKTSK